MKKFRVFCYGLSAVLLIYAIALGRVPSLLVAVGIAIFSVVVWVLIYDWQLVVARWLGCGIRYNWRDALIFFAFRRFRKLHWIVSFDEIRDYRSKLLSVFLSGLLVPIGLLILGVLFARGFHSMPFLTPVYQDHAQVVVAAVWFSFFVLMLLLCVVVLFSQLPYVIRAWNQSAYEVLTTSWVYRYSVELGLYKIADTDTRIRKCVELAAKSDDGKLCYIAGIYLHTHVPDLAKASDFYRRAFESPGFPEEVKWHAADGFITLALFSAPKPYLAKMDEYSEQLLAAKPQDLSVHGTRGSVLIELGRLDEGKRMLEGVLEKDENLDDRVICATYLAYAAHLERRPNDVAKYIGLALEADATNLILKRFAFLLPPEKSYPAPPPEARS